MIAKRYPNAWLIAISLFAAAPCLAASTNDTRQDALQAAQRRAAEIADRFAKTWAGYAIAEEWARTDPARAADLADQLPSWTAKRDLLSVVMVAWGQADPKAAGEWGLRFKQRTQGTLDERNTALRYAVLGMVAKDPKLADQLIWKHLEEEQWGGTPRTAPMEVARELAKSDPAAAMVMAEKITAYEPLRIDALRGILREWARKDPAAARAALGSRKEVEFQKAFPRDLAEGWASLDPRAAAAYAKTIDDRYTKVMALALVAREMARTDPQGGAELCTVFAALNAGPWHEQFSRLGMIVSEIAQSYAMKDLAAACAWADSLPGKPGGCRANASDGVATAWAEKDPKAALKYYTTAEKSGDKTQRPRACRGTGAAYPAIARQLARSDVPPALKLVAACESLVLKSHVIHDVAAELSRRDSVAAADLVARWAGIVDYYGYRTDAASVVAAAWAGKEPQQAAAWAAKLTPDRDRAAALRAVGAAWAKIAPQEALAWAKAMQDPHDAIHALVGVAAGVK